MHNSEVFNRQTPSSSVRNLSPAAYWKKPLCGAALTVVFLFVLGSPALAQSKLTPASLSFGSLAVGATSNPITAIFKNTQKVPLTIGSIVISGGNAPTDYAWSGNCPISPNTLAAGFSCNITVTFAPSALGNRITSLTVTSSAPTSPQSIALAGIGIAPVTVSPASLTFAGTLVGTTSVAKTVTLTNHLNTALGISSVAASGDFGVASDNCGSNVGAGQKCTIGVTFSPTSIGQRLGTLTINYGAFGSPTPVALSGTGNDNGLTAITVTPANPSIAAGNTLQFTATGHFKSGSENLTPFVAWSSSATNVATIAPGGLATAVTAGTTSIGAALGSIHNSTTLTVTAPTLVSIAVTPVNPSITKGSTQQFAAIGTYSNASTQNITGSVTWASSIPAIATIAPGGLATGVGTGTSNITATLGSVASPADTLTVMAPTLVSIAVTPVNPSIAKGTTQQFTATGTYSDASTQNVTTSVTWGSSSPSVATIAAGGLATGVVAGASNITATLGSVVSAGDTLTVTAATLMSIAVTPTNPSVAKGATQQFIATGTYSDSSTQNITASATWASSSPAVAAIAAGGLATGLSIGTSNITATLGSVVSSADTLTVTAPIVVSIAVSPYSVSLGLYGTQQYAATGTYSDGSTSDVTSQATWTSGYPALVSITSGGLATVLATSTSAIPITASLTNSQGTLITSPPAWLSALASLPVNCPTPTIDMKLLVISNAAANGGAGYADFPAIQQILNYVGTPYDVVDISGAVPALSDGACHAYYQGIIYAFGDDIYTNPAFYQALTPYEQFFKVRQLNWFTNPTPDFGFNYYAGSIPDTGTDSGSFAPAAAPVFFYANVATPVTIADAYIYLTTPTTPSGGGTVTPLLVDGSGYTLSGVTNFSDGRQYLSQMFDSNQYLTHDLVLAYGLVNWVTQGIFLGDYHVYASPQVDDFFIDDSEWIPGTTCQDPITHDRTKPDASNLPVFRVNSADMTQLATWQNGVQTDPSGLFSNFELTLAFNGVGTPGNGDWTGLTAPITATSSTNDLATFTTSDFSGLPGAQVNVTGTTNASGIFNGIWTILSATSDTSTTPATTQFTATITGAGTITQQAETGATAAVADDLVANLQSYQGTFHWISHTYNHPTTLSGLHKSDPGGDLVNHPPTDDIDLEVLTNLWVASSPGGVDLDLDPSDAALVQLAFTDFNPANMVTPGITGLNDPNVPSYLSADGIQYVVTDTSITGQPNNGPNPSPNVGIVNTYASGIYEVPRHPNDIYYNVANWNDDQAEFDCIYSYPTVVPPYATYTAAQILDFVSSSFLSNMLMGDMDPEMFHQPDLHFSINTAPGMPTSGQTSSLLADTYNQTFSLYKQVYNLPVLSPTLDQLGQAMQNRNSYNLSNVTASIIGAGGPNATISVTMPPSATVPTAIIPITGLNSTGAELYGGQYISYISVSAGQTITVPVQ